MFVLNYTGFVWWLNACAHAMGRQILEEHEHTINARRVLPGYASYVCMRECVHIIDDDMCIIYILCSVYI